MSAIRRIRFPRPRKVPERAVPISAEPADIVQDDYGRWAIGLHHDAPTFETRGFALAIAARQVVAA